MGRAENQLSIRIVAVDEFERGILQPEITFRHAVQAVRIFLKKRSICLDMAPLALHHWLFETEF